MNYRFRLLLVSIGFVMAFCLDAAAQISPGEVTGGASPWPVYVYDTEMLEKGNVIVSGIGGVGFLGDGTRSYSIYSELDLGITSRFLVATAVSGSRGEASNWNLDDTVIHTKCRILDKDTVDFAVAGIVERLPYMKESGYSAYDGQIIAIVQAGAGGFATYGQIGYSSRKQVFEGIGARYDFAGKAIVSGNFSYRHDGDFYQGLAPDEISGVKATAYATVYVPAGSRVGFTGAVGRTLMPMNAGDPATWFCTFGFGVRLH